VSTVDEAGPVELEQYLRGVSYPASRADLIATATANGADDEVLGRLRNIEDEEYEGTDAVSAAFTFEGGTSMRYGHVTIYDQ
jgi:Protein of unknown function (DUF2795)